MFPLNNLYYNDLVLGFNYEGKNDSVGLNVSIFIQNEVKTGSQDLL